ncbi:MAG: hypothetical protein WBN65_07890 [Gammaproteobacteria bacterium]
MNKIRLGIITTLVAGVMLAASASARECDGESELLKLKISVTGDQPDKVKDKDGEDAEDFSVCVDDVIEWKLVGQARQFFVDFGDRAPFSVESDGKHKKNSRNGKIMVIVTGPASDEPYKYDIGLEDGGVWDPRIKVED